MYEPILISVSYHSTRPLNQNDDVIVDQKQLVSLLPLWEMHHLP